MPGSTPSRAARLLLAGVAVDAFGTGLTVPLLVVYLHQFRGIPMETIGLVAGVPPAVGVLLLGPIGILIDRIGPRRVQMGALVGAAGGALTMAFADAAPVAFAARALTGLGMAAFWPANQSLVADLVPGAARQRFFGVSFALLNFGIGVGGIVAGLYVDVARPETFATVYCVDALTFLVPLVLLVGPLRHVGGPVAHAHAAGDVGYRAVLADRVFRRYLATVVVAAFVGYGQIEAGWLGYANVVARVPTRALGAGFALNTGVIVVL
jgi:MFS family permease